MKKTSFILSVILFQGLFAVRAQQTFGTLAEVWDYALLNNPEVNIRQLQINLAVQDKNNANSFLFPKVSAGFNGQDNIAISPTAVPGELLGKPGQTTYLKFGKHYNYNSGISASLSVLDWQSIYQSKVAKVNVQLNRAGETYFEQSLKEQLAQYYYASVIADKAVEISIADLAASDSVVAITENKLNQGLTDAISLNQARINRNNTFEKLEQNKRYKNQSLTNLKILLGIETGKDVLLSESIDNLAITNYSELVSNDKYTEQFRLQSDISAIEKKKALGRFFPKIDLTGYFGGVQNQDLFSMSFNKTDWNASKYIALSVSIPLFTGFSNKSQYRSAVIKKNIDEISYKNELRKSAMNDSILQGNLVGSIKIAISSKETFQIASRNVPLAQQKYKEGLINLGEYLKVFEDYLSVESQYINNISDYFINEATILSRK